LRIAVFLPVLKHRLFMSLPLPLLLSLIGAGAELDLGMQLQKERKAAAAAASLAQCCFLAPFEACPDHVIAAAAAVLTLCRW
jgi:hypothetical protein